MALAYIDDKGIHLPDYPTVLDSIKESFRTIYGDDLYLEADSQDGQLCAVFALALHDAYALAGSVYNAFAPSTAQGTGLSSMVRLNGITRNVATYSTADVRLVGTPGTVITGGVCATASGSRWLLPDTVNIPVNGELTVTATAEDAGDIRATAGEIAVIATPTRGWQSVSNAAAAVSGAAVETDAKLRARQAQSTAIPAQTVFEGTVGAVASLSGVTRVRGYENDTATADANGLPAHSICLVVEGGDASAIGQAIAARKTPGAYTHGGTAVTVLDDYGTPGTIRFDRPTAIAVAVTITIQAFTGYLSTTGEQIKADVAAAINALGIGGDVVLSRLYSPANAVSDTFDVTAIILGEAGGTQGAVNLSIAFNAVASCDPDDVTITVQP